MNHDSRPVFGPTEVKDIEGLDTEVVVRVALAFTREQLLAAIGLAFTDLPNVDPSTLSPDLIRSEVEGHLAADAQVEIDTTVHQGWGETFALAHPERYAQFATALEVAYPSSAVRVPSLPGPRYFDGQVMVTTIDRGAVVLEEPAWCIGHAWQQDVGRNDITHRSTQTKVAVDTDRHGPVNLLSACISWAPFADLVPMVSIALDPDSVDGDYQPEETRWLAAGLRTAAGRLETLADEAIRLRGAL